MVIIVSIIQSINLTQKYLHNIKAYQQELMEQYPEMAANNYYDDVNYDESPLFFISITSGIGFALGFCFFVFVLLIPLYTFVFRFLDFDLYRRSNFTGHYSELTPLVLTAFSVPLWCVFPFSLLFVNAESNIVDYISGFGIIWSVVLLYFALKEFSGASTRNVILVLVSSIPALPIMLAITGLGTSLLFSPLILIYVGGFAFLFYKETTGSARRQQSYLSQLKANTLNPRDYSAHHNLGLYFKQRRAYDEARFHFEKALEIDPEFADSCFELGEVLRESKKIDEALKCYKRVHELKPWYGYGDVYARTGYCYLARKEYDLAENALLYVLEKYPNHYESRYYLGQVYKDQGKNELAVRCWQELITDLERAPNFQYRLNKQWQQAAKAALRSTST